jgi:guanine deaminase
VTLRARRLRLLKDSLQYEDFDRPLDERRIDVAELRPDLGERAYRAWTEKPDRHHY